MMNRFIVFDVETPNHFNNRMSAIGISVIENGEIAEEKYYLVNPECEFDAFNIELTGITPEMVEDKMTFGELWGEIEPLFSSGLLMAHNAQFDMSVLGKCLRAYGINWKQKVDYACTCTMGKRLMPDFPNHKLDTMCYLLGFDLDHHNAGSDARAAALIMCEYLDINSDVNEFIRQYDMERICTVKKR